MCANLKSRPKSILSDLPADAAEWTGPGAHRKTFLRQCQSVFAALSKSERVRRQKFLERTVGEYGFNDPSLSPVTEDQRPDASLDLLPRYLPPDEWKLLAAGTAQRLRAFHELVLDLFNEQRILREGIIPEEVILRDPAYFMELSSLRAHRNVGVLLGAVDLVRTTEGEWIVVGQNVSNPTGIAQIVQIRRLMAQALPEVFDASDITPVASFTSRFAEALATLAPERPRDKSLVVILSEGEHSPGYFEESFLARHMGLILCQPADLVVRESQLFLRTIQGLMQVDVLYRRFGGPAIDPVAFGNADSRGIPGLLQCVRNGAVTVANGLGTEVADNLALLRYSDAIIRFYLRERPILRTVSTYTGFDEDQREAMCSQPSSFQFLPATDLRVILARYPEAQKAFASAQYLRLLEEHPTLVVGQQRPALSKLPVLHADRLSSSSATLRLFCLLQEKPLILPGGLTWTERSPTSPGRSKERRPAHFCFKDTWVSREDEPERRAKRARQRLEALLDPGDLPVPSRLADSMYWIGRYTERAQNTSRMALILEDLRWDELTPEERKLYTPLWKSVLRATSHHTGADEDHQAGSFKDISDLVGSARNPSSALSSITYAANNGASIRGFITPEFWRALWRARDTAQSFARRRLNRTLFRDCAEGIVDACDHIGGAGARTLFHDSAWRFFLIGRYLERAVTHGAILKDLLPVIARRQLEHMRDDTDLTALLRLMGALDAYHREYRSRAYLDRVVHLLWQNELLPASLAFSLIELRAALEAVAQHDGKEVRALLEELEARLTALRAAPIAQLFPARAVELDRGLSRRNLSVSRTIAQVNRHMNGFQSFVEGIHQRLEDRFLSHQDPTRQSERE